MANDAADPRSRPHFWRTIPSTVFEKCRQSSHQADTSPSDRSTFQSLVARACREALSPHRLSGWEDDPTGQENLSVADFSPRFAVRETLVLVVRDCDEPKPGLAPVRRRY